LVSDGTSDQALLPILTWLLREHRIEYPIQPQWADLSRLRRPPQSLADRIVQCLDLYPCHLLFVHRDAERQPRELRATEIRKAIEEALSAVAVPPAVCVVPVRMQEAWLLFDESALRWAAGNPSGRQQLELPRIGELEQLPDPKRILYELLREASGLQGRRRKRFPAPIRARRVAEFVSDFTPLRKLPAFNALDAELGQTIQAEGWHSTIEKVS
jgi:hypothetical protein